MSAEYNLGSLVNAGKSISEQNIKRIIQHSKKYQLKPSFLIAQCLSKVIGAIPTYPLSGVLITIGAEYLNPLLSLPI